MILWPPPEHESAGQASPAWRCLALRRVHSLVRMLLVLSCFVRVGEVSGGSATANALTLVALAVYVVFLGSLGIDRAARRWYRNG